MKKPCFGPKFKFPPFSVAEKSYFGVEIKFLPTSMDEKAIFGTEIKLKKLRLSPEGNSYTCKNCTLYQAHIPTSYVALDPCMSMMHRFIHVYAHPECMAQTLKECAPYAWQVKG